MKTTYFLVKVYVENQAIYKNEKEGNIIYGKREVILKGSKEYSQNTYPKKR